MKYLDIYLNDHLAAALVGTEVAKRSRANNRDTPLGAFLDRFADDLEQDKAALEQVMHALGIGKSRLKQTAAWMAEKLARMKLNGELISYSGLSRLVEIESLVVGVEGKLALWKTLKLLAERRPEFPQLEYDNLIRRAETQHRQLEQWRLKAAESAFAADEPRAQA